jgi:hypothetical protein
MRASKSSALDETLSLSGDTESYERETPAARKPATGPGKSPPRGSQAWRAIEDMKDNRRLDRKLKEVYE